jgi:hypothetical protein
MVLLLVAGLLATTAAVLWYLPRNSPRLWKITARIAAGILICISAPPLLVFLFTTAMCGRYEFPPVPSTDGKLAAEVSEEDCGAVDSFHSSVHLWQRREGFFAHLLGKRAPAATVFTVGHDPRLIDLSWKDDRTLLIRYPSDSRNPAEFRCQSQWVGVRIECAGYTPDYSKPVGKMPPVQRLW